ncbi:MAG TPA: phospholipase D-like domain-containing protein [Rhodanobacteraceae bacterium]
MQRTTKKWLIRIGICVVSVVATIAAVLAVQNLLPQEVLLDRDIRGASAVASAQFHYEVSNLPGPTVLDGNRIKELQNGAESFPAMLAAIRGARTSVDFETYVDWSGFISRAFASALSERARAGVPVHVLVDAIGGARMKDSVVNEMKGAGVEFHFFHPLHWWTLDRINNRDHRKILVVDGKVGFTGGIGIADEWSGDARRPDHWRDMQFQVEGPAVAQMQAVFESNWMLVTGHVLYGPAYFPKLPPAGQASAQMIASSPDDGSGNMQLMYLLAISAANKSIDLEASYFIPGDLIRRALKAALKRGVRVRIIVPGAHVDSSIVHAASQAQWGSMMAAGAHIYRYQPSLFHCKMMIVDGYLTMVGSANFDNRSFRLNDEANLNIYDPGFAGEMTKVFEQDLARSRETTLAQWRNRPWTRKAKDWLSSWTSSQL